MLHLGVNIDHVATLRQARYAQEPQSQLAEPDPLSAALICEQAGAHSITAHLREDRRHIQDRDIQLLREKITTRLNLEMGNTSEILRIALRTKPDDVCLVPENRAEITTEGGLDVVANRQALQATIAQLQDAGIKVSLFIDPEQQQIDTAAELAAAAIELHTGSFANAEGPARADELERLTAGAELANSLGLQVNAGHGINYDNISEIRSIPHLNELNIGHSIISRAVTLGLAEAVRTMLALMR